MIYLSQGLVSRMAIFFKTRISEALIYLEFLELSTYLRLCAFSTKRITKIIISVWSTISPVVPLAATSVNISLKANRLSPISYDIDITLRWNDIDVKIRFFYLYNSEHRELALRYSASGIFSLLIISLFLSNKIAYQEKALIKLKLDRK